MLCITVCAVYLIRILNFLLLSLYEQKNDKQKLIGKKNKKANSQTRTTRFSIRIYNNKTHDLNQFICSVDEAFS